MKIVKRILLVILIIIVIMCIAGYFFIKSIFQIRGVVVRNYGDHILILEEDGMDYVAIPKDNNLQFKKGQEVLVEQRINNDIVTQTYPGSIESENVKNIKIVKEKSKIEIPEKILGQFYNSEDKIFITINDISRSGLSFTMKDTNEYKKEHKFPNNYELSKKEENTYKLCKKTPENNENRKAVNWQKIDDSTVKCTYDWENIYGKIENGEYTFRVNTSDNYVILSINFTIEDNGRITYKKPTCNLFHTAF